MGVPTPTAYFRSQGWPTPHKKVATRWALSSLDRILSDPAYMGRHSAYRTQQFKQEVEDEGYRVLVKWSEQRASDHPDRIYYPHDVCPLLVDEQTWTRVQERRRRNKEEATRNIDKEKAGLLRAGYVLCGYCGHRMLTTHAVFQRGVLRRYTCRTHIYFKKGLRETDCSSGSFVSIHQEPLDRAVWTHVTKMLTDPTVLQETYDQLVERETTSEELHEDRLAAIEESMQLAEKRRRRAQRLAVEADDEDIVADYDAEAKQAAKDIRALEAEREQLATLHATRVNRTHLFADLIARKNDATARLLQMTTAERRDLLYSLGLRVRVYRPGHVDEESGKHVWWKIEADADRLVAHFGELPGYDRRRKESKPGDNMIASGGGLHRSLSTHDEQNSGKPWSRSTSGPRPAAT
jgi:site-specific DNA recombinase